MSESYNMDSLYTNLTSVSKTKNMKSNKIIMEMLEPLHIHNDVVSIEPIMDGMFNAVYRIVCKDENYIMKIAPLETTKVMRYEKDMMKNEVMAMEYLDGHTDIPIASIVYKDFNKKVCDSDYFVMKEVNGRTLGSIKSGITLRDLHETEYKIGELNCSLNQMTNNEFGYIYASKGQSKSWYKMFAKMMKDIISDSVDEGISLPLREREIMRLLEEDAGYIDAVKCPAFVHWDLWDRNVMLDNGEITGILDLERSFWGDYLMEYGFRKYNQSDYFLKGYGKNSFDGAETIRIMWYDVYWFIFNLNEGIYRGYNDNALYLWAKKMLSEKLLEIRER